MCLKGGDVKYMTKDTKVRFTLRITKNLMESIEKEANKQGVSRNALILQILWDWSERKSVGRQ
jgi:predicted HicB family RNase H-like nuclease